MVSVYILIREHLLCDLCDKWSHIRCIGVSENNYREFSAAEVFDCCCPLCLFVQLPCSDVIDNDDACINLLAHIRQSQVLPSQLWMFYKRCYFNVSRHWSIL